MQVHTKKDYRERKRILSKIPCHQPPKNITKLNNYIKEFTLRAQPEPLFHFLIMDEILGRLCLNRVKSLKSPRPELLHKSILFSGFFKCKHSFTDKPMVITKILLDSSRVSLECGLFIECFHSRCQHLCKFIGTKESVYIREEFNSHSTRLWHKHGHRFIVLVHKYGRHDVMWKHTIVESALSLSTQILRNK